MALAVKEPPGLAVIPAGALSGPVNLRAVSRHSVRRLYFAVKKRPGIGLEYLRRSARKDCDYRCEQCAQPRGWYSPRGPRRERHEDRGRARRISFVIFSRFVRYRFWQLVRPARASGELHRPVTSASCAGELHRRNDRVGRVSFFLLLAAGLYQGVSV